MVLSSENAMRFPRVTIRRLSLLVAALAVVLGVVVALQRRSERLRWLAAECASAVHSVYFADLNGEDGSSLTASVAGYHNDLSSMYAAAAKRPWLPLPSNEPPPDCVRAFWFAHRAVKEAYPQLALGDYNVFVTLDDSDDLPVWAVRYRRRDNRSGLTVFLRDSIEFEMHAEGPPQPEMRGMGEG
jgi:hypothetical protein